MDMLIKLHDIPEGSVEYNLTDCQNITKGKITITCNQPQKRPATHIGSNLERSSLPFSSLESPKKPTIGEFSPVIANGMNNLAALLPRIPTGRTQNFPVRQTRPKTHAAEPPVLKGVPFRQPVGNRLLPPRPAVAPSWKNMAAAIDDDDCVVIHDPPRATEIKDHSNTVENNSGLNYTVVTAVSTSTGATSGPFTYTAQVSHVGFPFSLRSALSHNGASEISRRNSLQAVSAQQVEPDTFHGSIPSLPLDFSKRKAFAGY